MSIGERIYWISDSVKDRIRLHRQLGIRSSDYVLDVGSGAGPNLRANVLCDKYAADGTERHGQALRSDRPCIVGDVEKLPFVDGAFDYVICSHLLEHVERPERALAELQRIAPRGYIETPSASWEKLQPYPFHRWLVSLDGGVLHFREKPGPVWDGELEGWFTQLQDDLGVRKQIWGSRRHVGLFTSLQWEGEIPYAVHRRDGRVEEFVAASTSRTTEAVQEPGGNLGKAAERWVSQVLRRASDRPWADLERLLACPACGRAVDRTDGGYSCAGCGTVYPRDADGRPWLLEGSEVAAR